MNCIWSWYDYISEKFQKVNGKTSTMSEFCEVASYRINRWKAIAFLY